MFHLNYSHCSLLFYFTGKNYMEILDFFQKFRGIGYAWISQYIYNSSIVGFVSSNCMRKRNKLRTERLFYEHRLPHLLLVRRSQILSYRKSCCYYGFYCIYSYLQIYSQLLLRRKNYTNLSSLHLHKRTLSSYSLCFELNSKKAVLDCF